ncbi:MAG: DUF5655 domain-containing protein [Putridiphycobacter sp.]|nr:DUF5655 domain-containing protein [Putridiphycobacter sp.]
MWTCSKCNRRFKSTNQSHMCSTADMGEMFIGKPDEQVIIFEIILEFTNGLEPNSIGPAKNAIVFTSEKAWLIVRPMKTVLDIKFYHPEIIDSERFHSIKPWGNKFAHHIRLTSEKEIDNEFFELLTLAHQHSLKS